jgi:hypothetical protein
MNSSLDSKVHTLNGISDDMNDSERIIDNNVSHLVWCEVPILEIMTRYRERWMGVFLINI